MGYFKIKSKKNLDDLQINDRIDESDYASLTPSGNFVQLEYIEEDEYIRDSYIVKPGLFAIDKRMNGLTLSETNFVNDNILQDLVSTKNISDKIDCFFKNIHKYKEWGIDVARRAMLLYGIAGSGKSVAIAKSVNKYLADGKTLTVIFPTDKFEAHQVKDFVKSFKYEGVEKMILVMEDIGGVEIDQTRIRSDSGLLSLLDNNEKAFTIPTFIIATTNFPEVFLGNLTNRPGRFDDKIEVGYPTSDSRKALLEFFSKNEATAEDIDLISQKQFIEFSPTHIKEAVIRAAIHDKTIKESLLEIIKEIELYKKNFSKQKSMGIYD